MRRLAGVAMLLALSVPALPPAARAQSWASLDVPDSARVAAVRAAGAAFEPAWNDLWVALLRARSSRPDSAARLAALARRVAAAESLATGGHIAADALRLGARWTPAERARRIEAAVAESLGNAAQRARLWPQALERFGVAAAHYRALGERRREAVVLGSMGVVAFSRGDRVAAESLYREALVMRRAIGDPRLVGNTLNALGSTNLLLDRPREAYRWFQEARAVRERTGERAALGATLNYLGVTAAALGERDSAAIWYDAALALTVSTGDSARTAEVLVNHARLLGEGGDRARALALDQRALANVGARGDLRTEAVLRQAMGDLLRVQGRFADADASLARAIELHIAQGDTYGLTQALLTRARVWIDLADGARARVPLDRALALADSAGDAVTASKVLCNLAVAAAIDGDSSGAERFATRALERAAASGDSALVHDASLTLGGLALDRGDPAAGTAWLRRALSAGGPGPVDVHAGDLVTLGNAVLAAGDLDRADSLYRAALPLAERAGAPEQVWPALLGRGEVEERRGDPAAALGFTRRAATVIDTLRSAQGVETASITLFARRMFAFDALVHLLQKTGHRTGGAAGDSLLAEAFAWSERARARALLDRLAAGGALARPVTLEEARRALDPRGGEALLVYSVGDSSSSGWLLTARGWMHRALPARRALRPRAEVLRRALADPRRALEPPALEAARALDRLVLEPFAPALRGVKRLVVVPDGPLARVPFEALLAADPRGGAVPRGAWIAERWAVRYEPSASALVARRASTGAARPGTVLAVGDPAFGAGPPSLPPLPHTADEIEALRALAGARATTLEGARATRAAVLAAPALAEAQVLHFATHGAVDEAEPSHGGLWLAAPDSLAAPQLLSVADVLGLRVRASLVTLSACETGLGRMERGEGVLGLTRAFMAAGAGSVVVSLWAVNDRSTSTLMRAFYDRALSGGRRRDEALAEARRKLIASAGTRSPFYWAPFVLFGDGGPLETPRR